MSRKKSVSCRVGLLSPMVFMLIAVGVLFVACPAPGDEGGGKTDITGSFTYNPVNATEGIATVSETPSWEGGAAGQTVTYSISVDPTTDDITVDASTGVVTVADTVTAGTYTVKVTATGSGDYSGTKEATLTVTVEKKAGLSYKPAEVTALIGNPEAMTIAPVVQNPNNLTLSYIGVLSDDSSLPGGISVNNSTGVITIEGNKLPALAKSYNVKVDMTGTGAGNVSETASAEVTVVVKRPAGTLSYASVSVIVDKDGASLKREPTWSNPWNAGDTETRTATYIIAPSNTGVTIVENTGVVTVPVTAVLSGTYTITAIPTGDFGGEPVTEDLEVRIATITSLTDIVWDGYSWFNYLRPHKGEAFMSATPTWSDKDGNTVTSLKVSYTVSPDLPAGLSLNANTGVISGTETTAQYPQVYTLTIKVSEESTIYTGEITPTITVLVTDEKATDVENLIKLIGDEITDQSNPTTPNLNKIDISAVTGMALLFRQIENSITNVTLDTFNPDISGWDVSKVVSMDGMFRSARAFNQNLNNWNVGMVESMYEMFAYAIAFNGDISGWDVSKVKSMYEMFRGYYVSSGEYLSVFNQDISDWNVSAVTDMTRMFYRAAKFTQDLEEWGTHLAGRAVTMTNMFKDSGVTKTLSWYE